jgi:hypothetical protein
MQTPAGYALVNGQFRATNWGAAMFNPSFKYRFPHILLGVLLGAAFLITGTAAWYLLKRTHVEFARRTFSLGLGVISLLIPLQLFMGDTVTAAMGQSQPPKVVAAEGNWDSTNTGYNLLIIPDQDGQRNIVQITVPCMGSVILNRDFTCTKPFAGLKATPRAQQPPMVFAFYGFHLMFYISMLMFFVTATGILLRLRGSLYTTRWFHRLTLIMSPAGVVAVLAGWVTAETTILLLATPVIPFYVALIGRGAEAISRRQMTTVRQLSATFLDYLQGIPTIKALGATTWARRTLAEASHELGNRTMAVQSVAFLSSAVMEFFSTFAIAIVATYIGLSLLKYIDIGGGPSGMSLQAGIFLLLLAPAYFQPLRAFAAAYHDRADALAASEPLVTLLSAPIRPPRRHEMESVDRIELRNVTVQYAGRTHPALSNISLSIDAGHKAAIVGPSVRGDGRGACA